MVASGHLITFSTTRS
uniref:Uncharacterized protein n=2 Tax=Timema TaxID=61471 RepID=A0A7R9DWR7_TIMPO|nr:unnamed protein product [Timema douglasi]CAD7421297.1 unnamed protein product [Timema poppensis]